MRQTANSCSRNRTATTVTAPLGRAGATERESRLRHSPVAQFTRYVRRPAGAMPAYTAKLLTDEQLADVYAYLKTLPAAQPPAQIPILDRSR